MAFTARQVRFSLAVVLCMMGLAVALASVSRAATLTATPSTFASVYGQAQSGDTILLASGSYGTWQGGSKQVTIRAADGATPTMRVNLGSGDANFTLDGIGGIGGVVSAGARDFTIRNSVFTGTLDLRGMPGANILLDGNTHDWPVVSQSGGPNAKLFVWSSSPGASSGVTVRNSSFRNGDLDGIHVGGGAGLDVLDNRFVNICDGSGPNHADMLQTEGMAGGRIAGNLFQGSASCATQALTSYDSGTVDVVLEDNVIDVRRPWGIEWYSDRNSIIRHNTVRYYPDSGCNFTGLVCGQIDIGHKTQDPISTGTQVYDNIGTVVATNGHAAARVDHNQNGPGVAFVGPLDTWAGFALASGSTGENAASDGLDLGIRVTPTPTPTPTPPPDTAALAVWSAPVGARVGQPVTLDGTASQGDAPIACLWRFEYPDGSLVQSRTGCLISFTFQVVGTKYVRLVVTDADGDTHGLLRTFTVSS